MFKEFENHDVAVYAGYIDNKAKLMKSASGGIATALAENMLDNKGYVAGVAFSKDFYGAEYILINDKSQLDRLKGSKYIMAEKNNIYSQVKNLINSGEKVLFFGLPCNVAALYKVLGERPENLITCELICHGPMDVKYHQEYLSYLENKYHSKLTAFSVRHKMDSWLPAYLYAEFENGKKFQKLFYETEYDYAFSVLGREACYKCKFKGNNRTGDIMIGDFWGATKKDEFWNNYGVSCIFAETEKGDKFLKSTRGIKLFNTTFERVVQRNPMVIKPKEKRINRDSFAKLTEEKGLIYATRKSISTKIKIKRIVRKAIPKKLKKLLK